MQPKSWERSTTKVREFRKTERRRRGLDGGGCSGPAMGLKVREGNAGFDVHDIPGLEEPATVDSDPLELIVDCRRGIRRGDGAVALW